MTTANSIVAPSANGVTVTSPPTISPADALTASYEFDTELEPLPEKPPAKVAAAATPAPQQPVQPVQTPPLPAEPKHPAWLLARAQAFGMHPLAIESLSTDGLTQVVMETMQMQIANRAEGSKQAATEAPVAAAATPQTPPEPAFDWGEHQKFDEYGNPIAGVKEKYTDEMFNPAVAHHIKTLHKEIAELKKIASFVETMKKEAVKTNEDRVTGEFDAAFGKFPDVFGAGNAAEVANRPDLMNKRRAVFGAVRGMFQAMPPELRSQMSIEQAVTTMAKSLYGKDPSAPVAAAAAQNHPGQKFQAGQVAVPTNRQSSAQPPGDAKARAAVREWWDDNKGADQTGDPADGATSLNEFF